MWRTVFIICQIYTHWGHSINTYVDKMRGQGVKKCLFLSTLSAIKSVHARVGGSNNGRVLSTQLLNDPIGPNHKLLLQYPLHLQSECFTRLQSFATKPMTTLQATKKLMRRWETDQLLKLSIWLHFPDLCTEDETLFSNVQ